jgi:hypothetical protein
MNDDCWKDRVVGLNLYEALKLVPKGRKVKIIIEER